MLCFFFVKFSKFSFYESVVRALEFADLVGRMRWNERKSRPSRFWKPSVGDCCKFGSFRKLGVSYFGGPYNKDPTT